MKMNVCCGSGSDIRASHYSHSLWPYSHSGYTPGHWQWGSGPSSESWTSLRPPPLVPSQTALSSPSRRNRNSNKQAFKWIQYVQKVYCNQAMDQVWQENASKIYVANLVQINWQFRPQIKNSGQHTALGRHAGQTFLSSQRSISGFFSFKIAMSFSYIDTFKELKRNFLRSQACPLHFPNRAV